MAPPNRRLPSTGTATLTSNSRSNSRDNIQQLRQPSHGYSVITSSSSSSKPKHKSQNIVAHPLNKRTGSSSSVTQLGNQRGHTVRRKPTPLARDISPVKRSSHPVADDQDGDSDEWVSSSGAQTPNSNADGQDDDSDSSGSEGEQLRMRQLNDHFNRLALAPKESHAPQAAPMADLATNSTPVVRENLTIAATPRTTVVVPPSTVEAPPQLKQLQSSNMPPPETPAARPHPGLIVTTATPTPPPDPPSPVSTISTTRAGRPIGHSRPNLINRASYTAPASPVQTTPISPLAHEHHRSPSGSGISPPAKSRSRTRPPSLLSRNSSGILPFLANTTATGSNGSGSSGSAGANPRPHPLLRGQSFQSASSQTAVVTPPEASGIEMGKGKTAAAVISSPVSTGAPGSPFTGIVHSSPDSVGARSEGMPPISDTQAQEPTLVNRQRKMSASSTRSARSTRTMPVFNGWAGFGGAAEALSKDDTDTARDRRLSTMSTFSTVDGLSGLAGSKATLERLKLEHHLPDRPRSSSVQHSGSGPGQKAGIPPTPLTPGRKSWHFPTIAMPNISLSSLPLISTPTPSRPSSPTHGGSGDWLRVVLPPKELSEDGGRYPSPRLERGLPKLLRKYLPEPLWLEHETVLRWREPPYPTVVPHLKSGSLSGAQSQLAQLSGLGLVGVRRNRLSSASTTGSFLGLTPSLSRDSSMSKGGIPVNGERMLRQSWRRVCVAKWKAGMVGNVHHQAR